MPRQSVRARRHGIPPRTLLALALLVPASAAGAGDNEALVIVNGRPISRGRVVEVLMDAYGLRIMQQLIVLELARQETEKRGLKVTPADVDREYQTALDRIVADSGMTPQDATPENKRQALRVVLREKHISMAEFMLGMERNAHLRKIVERDFKVDEATLREEFARTYGEKVHVRHIQLPADQPALVNRVVTLLRRGADFIDLARQYSVNRQTAERDGELPPFTFDDASIDPLLREAAFALAPGEVSNPVRTGKFFHILQLIERIAPRNVRFEDVRDQVEKNLRRRVITEKMAQKAVELFEKANIRVLDPVMRRRYQEFLKENAGRPASLPTP